MLALSESRDPRALQEMLLTLLDDVLNHDGFGDIRIEVRILKRQQKEVIIHYGKQYRYVLDWPQTSIHKSV